MKKIPTLFVRDFEHDNGRYVTEEVALGCEWVFAGEGVPTRKYDGTCVKLDESGNWWARREVKRGKQPPPGFCLEEVDPTTGKAVGWEPLEQSPFAKFHAEALSHVPDFATMQVGTYELVGPKVNGNPEQRERHELVRHAAAERFNTDSRFSSFGRIRQTVLTLGADGIEGIVWHHPDGRMAKIKARDFRVG